MLSNYTVFNIYREAGLPAGVINFVPADGPVFGETVTNSPHLAGINFTGSVKYDELSSCRNINLCYCFVHEGKLFSDTGSF